MEAAVMQAAAAATRAGSVGTWTSSSVAHRRRASLNDEGAASANRCSCVFDTVSSGSGRGVLSQLGRRDRGGRVYPVVRGHVSSSSVYGGRRRTSSSSSSSSSSSPYSSSSILSYSPASSSSSSSSSSCSLSRNQALALAAPSRLTARASSRAMVDKKSTPQELQSEFSCSVVVNSNRSVFAGERLAASSIRLLTKKKKKNLMKKKKKKGEEVEVAPPPGGGGGGGGGGGQKGEVEMVIPFQRGDATQQPPPDLPSYLFKNRIIYLGMSLVPAVTELIMAELLYLQYENAEKPVYMYINSTGTTKDGEKLGYETEAFAIYDTMMYVKCPIYTLCVGNAWGEAALLLAAGSKGNRAALPSATIMIKQPIAQVRGQATDIDIQRKEIRNVKTELIKLYARHTGQPEEKIEGDIRRPKYMSPDEAMEYRIIDKVLSTTKSETKGVIDQLRKAKFVA